jgi:hypothetical protein
MKYTIDAENESERAKIVERIKHFELEENLIIKHPLQQAQIHSTDVQCVIKNGDYVLSNKKEELHKELLVLIDEEEPSVLANHCGNCFMDARGQFISIGYGDMMVMICFKGHMYNTAFNEENEEVKDDFDD